MQCFHITTIVHLCKFIMRVISMRKKKHKNKAQHFPIDQLSDKKIILTGPPEVGKTTLKLTFFDNINPVKLLDRTNPILEPTRGAEISHYNMFNSEVGIFDLAGQENSSWYGESAKIFSNTDILVAIFDIKTRLGEITDFIISLLEIKKKYCSEAIFYIIIHKIDLISRYDLYKKIRYLKKFLKLKEKDQKSFEILTTSIEKEYFLDTYLKIQEIILSAVKRDIYYIPITDYEDLNLCTKIILKYEYGVNYYLINLHNEVKIPESRLEKIIELLKYLQLIKIKSSDIGEYGQQFRLTDRAYFLLSSIKKLQNNILDKIRIKSSSQYITIDTKSENPKPSELVPISIDSPEMLFYIFSNIKKKYLF
ncbi:MAG: hypothetical protein GF364_16890 [Candidatus Lokiarchaeota archaeon]|nr:hypothetical protein [Candidatus Lokiarchaeota archaeon]